MAPTHRPRTANAGLGDVWMTTNGNILFTRQSYVEEMTPRKKAVLCS
jgi:hypothetical protein